MTEIPLREFRCCGCGKLLYRYAIIAGRIEIKCWRSRCKTLNVFVVEQERGRVV